MKTSHLLLRCFMNLSSPFITQSLYSPHPPLRPNNHLRCSIPTETKSVPEPTTTYCQSYAVEVVDSRYPPPATKLARSTSSKSGRNVVRLSTDHNIKFADATTCAQSTVWSLEQDESNGKYLIATGGVEGNPGGGTVSNWFKIEKYDDDDDDGNKVLLVMASQQERAELDAKAKQVETVVSGGIIGKSLEAQEHLAEDLIQIDALNIIRAIILNNWAKPDNDNRHVYDVFRLYEGNFKY
ncbi:hypothetical protein OROHE_004904 [Orobanche hederae]